MTSNPFPTPRTVRNTTRSFLRRTVHARFAIAASCALLVGVLSPSAHADAYDGYVTYVHSGNQYIACGANDLDRYARQARGHDGYVSIYVNSNERCGGSPQWVLRQRVRYDGNVRHGVTQRYRYINGQSVLHRETPYVYGQIHGTVVEYDHQGRRICTTPYNQGNRHGCEITYEYRETRPGVYTQVEVERCDWAHGSRVTTREVGAQYPVLTSETVVVQRPQYNRPVVVTAPSTCPPVRQVVVREPVYHAPTYRQPTYHQPTYRQPTYHQPTTRRTSYRNDYRGHNDHRSYDRGRSRARTSVRIGIGDRRSGISFGYGWNSCD